MNADTQSSLSLTEKTLSRTGGKNILAIASGKGGVGKTWLSVTLAGLLAAQNKSVLLFDGDLGLANVDVQLGLIPGQDLSDVLTAKIPMNKAVTRFERGGFDVIAGRSGSGALAGINDAQMHLLRDDLLLLATHYDKVIVDLGSGITQASRIFAAPADTVLVLCSNEPTSLTDAYAFINVLMQEGHTPHFKIVVNSASSYKEGERTYYTLVKALENFAHIEPPLAGIIRRDTCVKDAVRMQTPVFNAYPDSAALQDVKTLMEHLKEPV
ncbi:MAG: AAA family ATPase [Alphaproteobacteria bacterium]